MPLSLGSPLPLLHLLAADKELAYVQETHKDQYRQSKPHSAATAANPASQGLQSGAPAPSPSSAAQAASTASFPGFSVLPSQQVAAAAPTGTAKPGLGRMAPQPSCSAESCLLQPTLSQEPQLPCYSSASEAHCAFDNHLYISPVVRLGDCTGCTAPHACTLLPARLQSEFCLYITSSTATKPTSSHSCACCGLAWRTALQTKV